MKISTKGRYALRMMLDLATHQGDGYVALKDIAQRQEISKKISGADRPVTEQIQPAPHQPGLSGRLPAGERPRRLYRRRNSPHHRGDLAPVACLQSGEVDCPRAEQCLTISVWEGLYHVINRYLDSITLQDILDSGPGSGDDYCI